MSKKRSKVENDSVSESEVSDSDENDDLDSDGSESDEEYESSNFESKQTFDSSLSLSERLKQLEKQDIERAFTSKPSSLVRRKSKFRSSTSEPTESKQKKDKNAPAEMRSNRPVKVLRDNGPTKPKSSDPRFVEYTGKINYQNFYKNYDFLDKNQEEELKKMSKALNKSRDETKRTEIKNEIDKSRQEMSERRRSIKTTQRLNEMKAEEMKKVREGKKQAFHLKRSELKKISLEERFKELKQEGKLSKFLAKKRKKNANKDHRHMPSSSSSSSSSSSFSSSSSYSR